MYGMSAYLPHTEFTLLSGKLKCRCCYWILWLTIYIISLIRLLTESSVYCWANYTDYSRRNIWPTQVCTLCQTSTIAPGWLEINLWRCHHHWLWFSQWWLNHHWLNSWYSRIESIISVNRFSMKNKAQFSNDLVYSEHWCILPLQVLNWLINQSVAKYKKGRK